MVYDEIVIRRTGPGLPTLSLVELPGFRAMEDGDLRRHELVDYYINEEEACRQYPRREAEARERHEAREATREANARERGFWFQPQPFEFPSLDTVILPIRDTIVICCADGEAVTRRRSFAPRTVACSLSLPILASSRDCSVHALPLE